MTFEINYRRALGAYRGATSISTVLDEIFPHSSDEPDQEVAMALALLDRVPDRKPARIDGKVKASGSMPENLPQELTSLATEKRRAEEAYALLVGRFNKRRAPVGGALGSNGHHRGRTGPGTVAD